MALCLPRRPLYQREATPGGLSGTSGAEIAHSRRAHDRLSTERRRTNGRTKETRSDSGRRCGGLQPAHRRRRGSHAGAAACAAQRPDRSHHCRAQWARGEAHRRRRARRVSQRRRRRALRHRGAECDDRAQRRPAAGAPHRVPHRHPHRRRRRGERRRPDGRRRQHRLATGGRRRARRHLSVRRRLSPGEGEARSRGQRSRRDQAEEHCRADAALFPGRSAAPPRRSP